MQLEFTKTDIPVAFDSYITGPQGAKFILYPVKGTHTKDDVERATACIRRERDVVQIRVVWVKAEAKYLPADKIPDFLIIKGLRTELGKAESYVQELESRLKSEGTKETQEVIRQIKSEELYTRIQLENKKLKKENLNLRGTISELISNQYKTE